MDDARLTQLEKSIQEIKQSQAEIANALLGSLKSDSVGLIEETRSQRKELDSLSSISKVQITQIQDLLEFKRDVKKIIAGIALIVPIVFELLKFGCVAILEFFKVHK